MFMRSFRIGYRTLKTAVGAGVSIAIASLLGLEFYSSAAIITILCISVTRRHSLFISWARFIACIIALLMGAALFEWLGYTPWVLTLLLLIYIPVVVMFKVQEGFITSCVILLHLYVLNEFSWGIFWNELQLIIIGVGIALLANVYMPNDEKKLREYVKDIEATFSIILKEIAFYLREGDSQWDGKEINDAIELLEKANHLAEKNVQNHLRKYEDPYFHYFHMRSKQFEVLERLLPFVSSIQANSKQSEMIADFVEELSKVISPADYGHYYIDQLDSMRLTFKEMELPATRDEFEERSHLFYIVYELNQYLALKNQLWNHVDKTEYLRTK
ncbi:aromatic acid exporter family protein [Alkalihalobacillus trypoxylicola]|nr:aromatic acid exporter family protein [Alkalihalobacillus trypoxylicola]